MRVQWDDAGPNPRGLLIQQAPLRDAVPAHSWKSMDVDTSKWATELWRPFLLKAAILASARSCSEMQNL